MVWVYSEQDIIMSKPLSCRPELHAKLLSEDLLAVKGKDNYWKVVKVELEQ
jgi:hypothetical protein